MHYRAQGFIFYAVVKIGSAVNLVKPSFPVYLASTPSFGSFICESPDSARVYNPKMGGGRILVDDAISAKVPFVSYRNDNLPGIRAVPSTVCTRCAL